MGLIREPKNVDFSMRSNPWKEEDVADFRILMNELKAKNARRLMNKRVTKSVKKSKTVKAG